MMEQLTKSEAQVMALLWASDRPLSCSEIVELSHDKTWKDSYVHSLIKSLTKKGIVTVAAFELISRSYARKFAPKVSYDEYVLLSSFSAEELRDTDRMFAFIRTLLNHTDAAALRARLQKDA